MKANEVQEIHIQRQNKFLETLNNLLFDIQALQPTEIGLFILNNSRLNVQNHVVHLICNWFQRYNGYQGAKLHQDRIKFIHCFDKLIRHKDYCQLINASLTKIFCDAFYSYNRELNFQKLQDLKILFHIWSPYINHYNSSLIKNQIERITRIDIYKHLKKTSRKFIQNYFAKNKKVNLSEKRKNQNNCFKVCQQVIFNQKPSQPRSQATTTGRSSNQRQDDFWDLDKQDKKKMDFVQSEVLKKKIKAFTEAFPFQQKLIENEVELTKVSLLQKQENIIFSNQQELALEKQQVQRQKQKQKIVLQKIQMILTKLRQNNQYECNRCGKSMITKQKFDTHMQKHFQQSINNYRQSLVSKQRYNPYIMPSISSNKILKSKQKIMNVSQWINVDQGNKTQESTISNFQLKNLNINFNASRIESQQRQLDFVHQDSHIVKKCSILVDYCQEQSTNDSSDSNQDDFCECRQKTNYQIKSQLYKTCYFCGENIKISIENSKFVYENALKVQGKENIKLMHKDCYEILLSCSQSQQDKKYQDKRQ